MYQNTCRKAKREWKEQRVIEAAQKAECGRTSKACALIRGTTKKKRPPASMSVIKDDQGRPAENEEQLREVWSQHFLKEFSGQGARMATEGLVQVVSEAKSERACSLANLAPVNSVSSFPKSELEWFPYIAESVSRSKGSAAVGIDRVPRVWPKRVAMVL